MRPIDDEKERFRAFILCASALGIFMLQHAFRVSDDNTLTSWYNVFGYVNASAMYAVVALAAIAAYTVSFIGIPRAWAISAIAFIASAAFWREPEVIIDASRYFTQAKHLSEFGVVSFLKEWGTGIEAWTDMPLVPFIYGLGFKFFGEHRFVIQAINSAMFAGTVWFLAKTAEEIWPDDTEIGPLSGFMLLAIPYLYTQIPLMLVDAASMFLFVVSVCLFLRALTRGGFFNIALSGLCMAALMMSKYSMWMFASSLGIVWALKISESPKSALKRGVAVSAVASAGFGAFLWVYRETVSSQMRLLIEYQKPGLDRWGESYLSTLFFQTHPFMSLAAIAGIALAIKRRDLKFLIALWPVALLAALEVKRIRYSLPAFPMLALMSAYGLSAIRTPRLRHLTAHLAVSVSFILASFAFVPYLKTNNLANLADLGRYLDTLDTDAVRVVTLDQETEINPASAVPLLDLETRKRIVYEDGNAPCICGDEMLTSAFRFTWSYKNPSYYLPEKSAPEPRITAVISDLGQKSELTDKENQMFLREFSVSEGRFTFKAFARVYERLKQAGRPR